VAAMTPPGDPGPESPLIHQLKNHLSIVVGFCDLLLNDLPHDDEKRVDLQEMRKAAQAALDLIPDISTRMR
jgi:hypothetical protein